jgi:hypothetical protein
MSSLSYQYPICSEVVLSKNGVGYFEHVGTVHGNESVKVSFTSGQLNDVLKSLTVLDRNGGVQSAVPRRIALPTFYWRAKYTYAKDSCFIAHTPVPGQNSNWEMACDHEHPTLRPGVSKRLPTTQ